MSSQAELDFHFMAGRRMSLTEIADAWMAFRELRRRHAIVVDFCADAKDVNAADSAGWNLGVFGKTRMRRYLERMEADPYSFFLGHEWGIDIYVRGDSGRVVLPWDFSPLLTEVCAARGEAPRVFSEASLQRSADIFRDRNRQALEAKAAASQPTPVQIYETSPLLFWRDLFATYRIANGKASIEKTFLGMPFGYRPEVPLQDVRQVVPKGGPLWGDVVFSNGSQDAVVWKGVFRPDAVKRQVDALLALHIERSSTQLNPSLPARNERQCPFCAETILAAAKLCKHCHQRIDQDDSTGVTPKS